MFFGTFDIFGRRSGLEIYLSFDRCLCFEYVEFMKTLCNVILFQWQELIARKPKEGEEDPVLVEEIRKARENVGMYTRKTSLEYEETDPIRFETHKSQLVTLLTQVSILNIRKLVFNHNSQMWKFRSDEVDSTTKLNKKFYIGDKLRPYFSTNPTSYFTKTHIKTRFY